MCNGLNDQTQLDSKPVGLPEHASLKQCQLIAANRPKLVLWAPPGGSGDKVSQDCNPCESPDWSLFRRDLALMPYLVLLSPGMSPALNYGAYTCSNWSLATYPFFSSSKVMVHWYTDLL